MALAAVISGSAIAETLRCLEGTTTPEQVAAILDRVGDDLVSFLPAEAVADLVEP